MGSSSFFGTQDKNSLKLCWKYFQTDVQGADFSKFWNPKIVISNSAPSASIKRTKSVRLAKNGEAYIIEKLRIKGIFSENLELHEFPFDIQVNKYLRSFIKNQNNIDRSTSHESIHSFPF